jgi:hypothetical protein
MRDLHFASIPIADFKVNRRPPLVIPTGAPEERSGEICSSPPATAFNVCPIVPSNLLSIKKLIRPET